MQISNPSVQLKIALILSESSDRNKWREQQKALVYLNEHLTRHYIEIYWKHVLKLIISDENFDRLTQSIQSIPKFIDCLHLMNLKRNNEIVYSLVYLLFSRPNCFRFAKDILQMYHLTSNYSKEKETSLLTNSLNTDLLFIRWKEQIQEDINQMIEPFANDYTRALAEKCIYQLNLLVESFDIADNQIMKLSKIHIYYGNLEQLNLILHAYCKSHSDYLNAHKLLFDFELEYMKKFNMNAFQNITKLCPSDSLILKNLKNLKDQVMSLDCMFDMLDFYQWKYDKTCWKIFNKLLLRSNKIDAIRECINENWNLRQHYWIPYHFQSFSNIYTQINEHRLSVALILLGPRNKFVGKLMAYLNKNDFAQFRKQMAIYDWLNE